MLNKAFNFKTWLGITLLLLVVSSYALPKSEYVRADDNEGDGEDSNQFDGHDHFDDNEQDANRSKCCLNADTASAPASFCTSNFDANCLSQIQSLCGSQPTKDCCKMVFRGQCRGQCERQHQACKCDRHHPCLSAGTTCIKGHCVCPPGETICGDNHSTNFGQCVNLLNSTSNCGACGTVCPNGQTCQNGICQATTVCVGPLAAGFCGICLNQAGTSCVGDFCCGSLTSCANIPDNPPSGCVATVGTQQCIGVCSGGTCSGLVIGNLTCAP